MPTATGSAHQGSSDQSQENGSTYDGAAAAQAEPSPRAHDTSPDIEELVLWKIAEKLNAQESKMVGIKLGMPQTQLENLEAKVRWDVSSQEEMNFEMLHKWHANQTPDDDPEGTLRHILATDVTLSAELIDELFKQERFTCKPTRERLLGPQQLYEIAQRVNKTQHIPLVLRLGFTFNELLNCNIHEADQRLYEMLRRWQKNLPRAMDQIGIMSDILSASGHRRLAYHIRNNHWNKLVGERGSSLIWEPETNDISDTFRELDLNITSDNPEVHSRMNRILENCTPIPEHLNQPEASTQEKTKSVYDQCRQTSEYLTELQGAINNEKMYETIGFTVSSVVLHIRVYSTEGLQKLQEDVQSGDLSRRLAQVITPETSASLSDHAVPHVTLSPGTFHLVSQQTTGRAVVSPELKEKLTEAGLDVDYWTSILESRLEMNLPQGIQNLGETHLKDLEPHITQYWEKEALMKLLGIKSGPASPKAEKEGESPIVSKLFEAGLDGEYWANVLHSKLGITKCEQIANLNSNDFRKLKDYFRYEWEENALRKLFCINDEANEESMIKRQKRHKEMQNEIQNLLREIGEMGKAGIQRTDAKINFKLERLRVLLSIPKKQWIKGNDDERFYDTIGKMTLEVQRLVSTEPLKSTTDILENASGGLALKGVLVGKAFQDCCVKHVALSAPTNVVLMNPEMQQIDSISSFSSKTQSDHFHETLDTMGYSFAAFVQGGRWGFEDEALYSREKEEQEVTSEIHTQTHLESMVQYSVVPTASCKLNPHSLKLSKQALQKLMAIDRILEGSKNLDHVDRVHKKCKEFFSAYGSHINAEVLQFGGVYKFVGTYTSETNAITDQIKLMVRDALDIYASAGLSGLRFSDLGSVTADQLTTHGSDLNVYQQSELAKINLNTQRNGGPPEVSVLPLWKMGLVTCNSTWALIDRGKSLFGIWNLVSNHRDEFQNSYKLESTLVSVWEEMSGYTGSRDQQRRFRPELYAIVKLIEKISRWNSEPVLPKRCIGYLQEIREAISELGTNKYWVDKLCTKEHVSSFLQKIVDLKYKFDPKALSDIQLLIRILVKPVGSRKFPGKEKIMNFAGVSPNMPNMDVPCILDIASITSIPTLFTNLKESFAPALQMEHAKNGDKNEQASRSINARATRDLALCVGQLLKILLSSEKTHELFFLKVVLLSLDYHWATKSFKTLVTMEKLDDFVQSTEVSWEEFQVQQGKGSVQLEGFLIHKLLTAGHFNEGIESSEKEFSELIQELRQVISSDVNMVLNRYATDSPYDWIDMRKVFAELAKGNMSVTGQKEVNVTDLEKIAYTQFELNKGNKPVGNLDSGIAAQGKFKDILHTLGLSKYYPSKITVTDAISLKNPTGCYELIDIPWVILKKLVMIDFLARDKPFSEVKKISNQDESDGSNGFDSETDSVGDETCGISTLDALVALFACCDNFLKQIVAQRLFVCKLAIPFIYPLGSEENVGMSLWAFRTIIVQCESKNKQTTETPVTEGLFPLVTFIRLGRPPVSKSKLLNDVLRDDGHCTFFHVDCENGTEPRKITDGLVDCSWHIAGTKGEDLPRTTMFLNLRGDATFLEKQLKILQEISSVIFVLVTVQDLVKSPYTETCQQLLQINLKVILLLITSSEKTRRQERQECRAAVRKGFDEVSTIWSHSQKGKWKNASELKTEARRNISKAINECSDVMFEECVLRAKNMGVIIDEYVDDSCHAGKKLAEKVSSHIKGKEIENCRHTLLPLQCSQWTEYSKLMKKQHRAIGKGSHESPAYYADQVKQNMDRLRKEQVEACKSGLSPFIGDFVSGLQRKSPVAMYFLKWMGLFLDEKSRSTLPAIRKEYHETWIKLQDAKQVKDEGTLKHLKSHVHNVERKIANASLGLENLFREMGQVYEAMAEGGNLGETTKSGVECLTEIAAELLLDGIPLELVDGDTSSVPITWTCAVLNKVENLIGDKKMYVISVLGIQSSGKSTLLNTMFGLQFAASAGRCTRGAYMQLIPVDEKAGWPFDYAVVVDTEGLRAPELGQLKYEHDNELATLVIGLGDVTLINIKGENTAEINDILQIAVHAFLRMNLVKRNIRDNRTCVFIHQNVSAVDANEKMGCGSQKLKENLDEKAKEAALSEGIANIHSFSQIINFDIEKHVWYFPDLWHGNPPMAPANRGYSEKVNELKLNILEKIAQRNTFLTASELAIRLADLWKGVLADDFVFSFRNSLEIKAYNSLQSTYYTLEWEFQNKCQSWFSNAEIRLKRSESIDELETSFRSIMDELPKDLSAKAEETRNSLQNYFEDCDLRHIIIQWQQSKINQLTIKAGDQKRECRVDLQYVKEARQVELLHAQERSKNERHIMNKAIELAHQLKGKEASGDDLKEKFNCMWIPMVNKLGIDTDDKELKMDVVMKEILYEIFFDHSSLLDKELEQHPLTNRFEYTFLESSIPTDFVSKEHISLKEHFLKKVAGVLNKGTKAFAAAVGYNTRTDNITPEQESLHQTMTLTHNILEEIGTDLRRLTHDVKFNKSQPAKIIKRIVDYIDAHNQKSQSLEHGNFTIRPIYTIKLAVHVSQYCVQVFSSMQSEYNKEHGTKAKLEAYKDTAWSLFKSKVEDATEEVLAGDLLCKHLKKAVQKSVKEQTPRKCTYEILRDLEMNKYRLLVKIMDSLAVEENFKKYMSFIQNAKEFSLQWLTEYTNDKFFSQKNNSGISRYAEIANSHVGNIMQCITESVLRATSEVTGQSGMKMWIKSFCNSVSDQIAIPVSDLSVVSDRKVMDINNFERVVLDQLVNVQADLESTFVNVSKYSVDWDGSHPPLQVIENIWGCSEQCPFCHEPCADTTPNHFESSRQPHMCVQHRPDGLSGKAWGFDGDVDGEKVKNGELSNHSCNYDIQLEGISFRCGVCKNKCRNSGKCYTTGTDYVRHKYVEYKTFLPDWDIAPDRTNNVSKYWMWFMATYQHQLKDWYSKELPAIPASWRGVTKEEALADLRKIHH